MIDPLSVVLWLLALLLGLGVLFMLGLIAFVVMSAVRDGRRG